MVASTLNIEKLYFFENSKELKLKESVLNSPNEILKYWYSFLWISLIYLIVNTLFLSVSSNNRMSFSLNNNTANDFSLFRPALPVSCT